MRVHLYDHTRGFLSEVNDCLKNFQTSLIESVTKTSKFRLETYGRGYLMGAKTTQFISHLTKTEKKVRKIQYMTYQECARRVKVSHDTSTSSRTQ